MRLGVRLWVRLRGGSRIMWMMERNHKVRRGSRLGLSIYGSPCDSCGAPEKCGEIRLDFVRFETMLHFAPLVRKGACLKGLQGCRR
jgi:hypothetical protein